MSSNQDIVKSIIVRHPGLRFHEIKKETKLANGTLQHHLSKLGQSKSISTKYVQKVPRYYSPSIEKHNQTILLRLRQTTTSRIIKSLLKNKCMNFSQLVKESKKSPGTVSLYKNMLLKDGIIVGNTDQCSSCPKETTRIKYKLIDPSTIRILVEEYGKSSLRRSSDNLSDIFLSL